MSVKHQAQQAHCSDTAVATVDEAETNREALFRVLRSLATVRVRVPSYGHFTFLDPETGERVSRRGPLMVCLIDEEVLLKGI